MNISDIIRKRRSVRTFTGTMPPEDIMTELQLRVDSTECWHMLGRRHFQSVESATCCRYGGKRACSRRHTLRHCGPKTPTHRVLAIGADTVVLTQAFRQTFSNRQPGSRSIYYPARSREAGTVGHECATMACKYRP